jgi:hypothetical protein
MAMPVCSVFGVTVSAAHNDRGQQDDGEHCTDDTDDRVAIHEMFLLSLENRGKNYC